MSEENLSCSFCGLSKLQTKVLVAGQDAHICDQCIEQAFSILNHQKENDKITTSSNIQDLNPKKIKSFLDEYVVGQEYAKKIIGEDDFFEIFVKSSFEKCKQRDVKGLYAKLDKGKISSFTGKDSAFEDPTAPWLMLDTENTPLESSMTKLSSAIINEVV